MKNIKLTELKGLELKNEVREILKLIGIENVERGGIRIKHFKKDQIIFCMGDIGKSVYLILTGRVLMGRILHDGGLLANILNSGYFIGEYLDTEEMSEATAKEDLLVLSIPKRVFLDKLLKIPGFQHIVMENDCKKRKMEAGIIDWICSKHAAYRIGRAMILLSNEVFSGYAGGDTREIRVTHNDLKDITNLTRESVTRTLGHFKSSGYVVEARYRFISFHYSRLLDAIHNGEIEKINIHAK